MPISASEATTTVAAPKAMAMRERDRRSPLESTCAADSAGCGAEASSAGLALGTVGTMSDGVRAKGAARDAAG